MMLKRMKIAREIPKAYPQKIISFMDQIMKKNGIKSRLKRKVKMPIGGTLWL